MLGSMPIVRATAATVLDTIHAAKLIAHFAMRPVKFWRPCFIKEFLLMRLAIVEGVHVQEEQEGKNAEGGHRASGVHIYYELTCPAIDR